MNRGFVRIIRIADHTEDGMFGTMKVNEIPFCVTLEPEYRQNKVGVSGIPVGQHVAKKFNSPTYGWTWRIEVYGRTYVLFHAGNVVKNTKGCVLVAEHYGKLHGNLAVLNSGNTFKKFLKATWMYDELMVTVTESF